MAEGSAGRAGARRAADTRLGSDVMSSTTADSPAAATKSGIPRRSYWALWLAMAGVAVVLAFSVAFSVRLGVRLLAIELAALAVLRLASGDPGPAGLGARSRPFDAAFLGGSAVLVAVMSFAPNL